MIRIVVILVVVPLVQIWACTCLEDERTPQRAADRAAAVFTGTVLSISNAVPEVTGRLGSNRVATVSRRPLASPSRIVLLRVGETLSGVPTGQAEVEVATSMSECGFRFEAGQQFFVYAYRNPEGKLHTNICTRTRPIEKAAEDLAYLRAAARHRP